MMGRSIPVSGPWKLTGATRPRLTWINRVVVQVEEARKTGCTVGPEIVFNGVERRWRDARDKDFVVLREVRRDEP
jgi:hypothetical protein